MADAEQTDYRPPPFQFDLKLVLWVTFAAACMLGASRGSQGLLAAALPLQIGLVVLLLYLTWHAPPTGILLGSLLGLVGGGIVLARGQTWNLGASGDVSMAAVYLFAVCAAAGGGIHAVYLEYELLGWMAVVVSLFGCCSGLLVTAY